MNDRIYYKRILSLAIALIAARGVYAQYWTNGQAASYVIGQPGFGVNAAAVTATGLNQPAQAIIDPATGKVFVCDQGNNRILRYPSTAAMSNGAAAEAVLGQGYFTTNAPDLTADGLNLPSGIAIDASGNLWVADASNNRVLRYANAATIASGAAASGVLGQPNFVTANYATVSSKSMYIPESVFCSGTTLWVADTYNMRVLRFGNAASLANGSSAAAEFGQPNFTTGAYNSTPSATQLSYPTSMYVDGAGNLWVADDGFNRVLMFPNAPTAANGEAATLVLGQTDFVDDLRGLTAATFDYPSGIYGDEPGNMYVTDYGNSRILIFRNAASLSNGSAATYVLGQTNFSSNGAGDGAGQVTYPSGLFVSTSVLLAADVGNNRVLVYIPLEPLPLTLTAFTGRLQDNGQVLLQWQISGSGDGAGGGAGGSAGAGGAATGTVELEYATSDTSGFNTVLSTQSINPTTQNYSYLQISPAAGVNYYRLRLTAPDGSYTYSPIVSVIVGSSGGTGSTGLTIYPNPARSSVEVTVLQAGGSAAGTAGGGTTAAPAEIGIYSSTGMLMQRLVTGATVNHIDISRLAAGVYTVTVVQGGHAATGSFIKMN
jgi:sugar lactone lactonase YvrE